MNSFSCLAVAVLLAAPPAMAQTPDPHAGHAMPANDASALPAPAPVNHDAMPPMDHSAMPGMTHGNMDMGAKTAPGKAADPMAGMEHGAMGGMVMPDGTVMQMAATPKGILRRNVGPAEAAVQGFADAIEVGNRELAMARLAPDLVVIENGSEDDYAGYVGGHLASDIAFSKTVKTILLSRQVRADGKNRAVITSTSRMMINRSDRKIDLDVAEAATVAKVGSDWKISRITWQSGPHTER